MLIVFRNVQVQHILLCLYMLTGGVAKYVAQLIAGGMTTQNQIDTIIGKNTGTGSALSCLIRHW